MVVGAAFPITRGFRQLLARAPVAWWAAMALGFAGSLFHLDAVLEDAGSGAAVVGWSCVGLTVLLAISSLLPARVSPHRPSRRAVLQRAPEPAPLGGPVRRAPRWRRLGRLRELPGHALRRSRGSELLKGRR